MELLPDAVAFTPFVYDAPADKGTNAIAPVRIAAEIGVSFDLLRLPRAEVSSEAATHAPRASFQILLYDLFIEFELGS
ncbi:hypothetical protein NU688_23875 [Variovorax sp. ZS18.2.2]|nr:hypothetical protein [Variovorax sp. ZS18.2.2]MCR6479217.1 hypothetical protein [Variovorax sp. ZS18.2.2]